MFLSPGPEELSRLDILRIPDIQFQTHDLTSLSELDGLILGIENIDCLTRYPTGQDVQALSH